MTSEEASPFDTNLVQALWTFGFGVWKCACNRTTVFNTSCRAVQLVLRAHSYRDTGEGGITSEEASLFDTEPGGGVRT